MEPAYEENFFFSYSSRPASASPALVPPAGWWACSMATPVGLLRYLGYLAGKQMSSSATKAFQKATVEVEPFPQKVSHTVCVEKACWCRSYSEELMISRPP